jgi:hypothetical protein
MITYQQAKDLKEAGFPQKKNRYSQYYLTPDYIIDFETAHNIYMSNTPMEDERWAGDNEIKWSESLIYIPKLEDFVVYTQFLSTKGDPNGLIAEKSYNDLMDSIVEKYTKGNKEQISELIKRYEDAFKKDKN